MLYGIAKQVFHIKRTKSTYHDLIVSEAHWNNLLTWPQSRLLFSIHQMPQNDSTFFDNHHTVISRVCSILYFSIILKRHYWYIGNLSASHLTPPPLEALLKIQSSAMRNITEQCRLHAKKKLWVLQIAASLNIQLLPHRDFYDIGVRNVAL